MEGGQGNSYGGRFSGGDFDLIEFLKRPQTICRLLCILFAIVVFGCISSAGYDKSYHHCIFNKNQDACNYGIAIGVLAFVGCVLFIAVDTQFHNISNTEMRRYAVTGDLVFSGLWTFLWFVGFCFLTDQWRKSATNVTQNQTNHARAAIAFSFFSIFTWIALTLMGYQRYRQGDGLTSSAQSQGPGLTSSQSHNENKRYASFPFPASEDDASVSYQQQPFGVPPAQPFGVPPKQSFSPQQSFNQPHQGYGGTSQPPFGVPPQTEYSVPE